MESSEQPFDVSNTPEYMKTYVNVLMNTLLEMIQTSTDAKTRMTLLDSICRQQKQQNDVLNDTVTQLTNGLQSTSSEYHDLDSKCTALVNQLTDELNNARTEVSSRLEEIRILSSYEEKFKVADRELTTVSNNYTAMKTAYEDLMNKYEELSAKYNSILQKQESSVTPTSVSKIETVKTSRKKQRSEDTGWD